MSRKIDYQALAEFRYRIRSFLAFSEAKAREFGLEPQQHQVLLAIKGLPEGMKPTVSNVAKRMLLKHHSTVGLVIRLVTKGLLRKAVNKADTREVLLRISPKGERILRRLSAIHQAEIRRLGPQWIRQLRGKANRT